MLDSIQEDNLGLIRAMEKFDYAQGIQVSIRDVVIRQAITGGMADRAAPPSGCRSTCRAGQQLRANQRELHQRLGGSSDEEPPE